jgi:hypothetical protein
LHCQSFRPNAASGAHSKIWHDTETFLWRLLSLALDKYAELAEWRDGWQRSHKNVVDALRLTKPMNQAGAAIHSHFLQMQPDTEQKKDDIALSQALKDTVQKLFDADKPKSKTADSHVAAEPKQSTLDRAVSQARAEFKAQVSKLAVSTLKLRIHIDISHVTQPTVVLNNSLSLVVLSSFRHQRRVTISMKIPSSNHQGSRLCMQCSSTQAIAQPAQQREPAARTSSTWKTTLRGLPWSSVVILIKHTKRNPNI